MSLKLAAFISDPCAPRLLHRNTAIPRERGRCEKCRVAHNGPNRHGQ